MVTRRLEQGARVINAQPAVDAICDMVDPELPPAWALAGVVTMIARELGLPMDDLIHDLRVMNDGLDAVAGGYSGARQ